MAPAKPPLPMPWNLPFQPELGIQTSSLISESLEGFSVMDTRQKAGTSLRSGGPSGGLNGPGGTDCAALTAPPASLSVDRLSHVAAVPGSAREATHPSRTAVRSIVHFIAFYFA